MKYVFVFLLHLLKSTEEKKSVVCTSLKNSTEVLNVCITHLADILQF